MSNQISSFPSSAQNVVAESLRRTANYRPSVWGDHFLAYASNFSEIKEENEQEFQQLKEEVRKILKAAVFESSEALGLIDVIQRLGVSYHFEDEINQALQHIWDSHQADYDERKESDIYTISLQFRLLRQQGYAISCEVFNKFKDDNSEFKASLVRDVRGMLSLYEATHLRVHGEDILEEALAFTTSHLSPLATNENHAFSAQLKHALNRPIRKSLQRLDAKYNMKIYAEDKSHNQVLLKFAKLDFNLLQKVHQKELADISKWWKDLDFALKLPFARDRVVECYFWILGVYFEPQYFFARKVLTKVIAMTSVMDDIYDVYGTLEEIELLTEAIDRWDANTIDQFPEYMKVYYQAFLDVYYEIEKEMTRKGRSYCVHYAKQAMKNLSNAYFVEAKWFHFKNIPTMEEYMPVALVTSAYAMLATTSLVGMGDMVTKEIFEWVVSGPKIIEASSIICRLMDDIVSNKFEQKRGHVASAIECYMKQYGGSEQQAIDEFNKRVKDAWKDVNEECLHPTVVPMPVLIRVLNLARVIDLIYKDEDGYTNVGSPLKNSVASLLVDPVLV